MVVDQTYVASVAFLKAEGHAPVRPDPHAPVAFHVALERVKPETRQVHVIGLSGTVENGENIFDPFDMIGPDALRFAVLKKPFQALVPETLNHKTAYDDQ
jgi:hypothetical protein